MKIKRLKMKNFAKFSDFEIEFKGSVTRLVGVNGSGKTTIGLTAIWACLKGIAESAKDGQLIGERFRFIGSSKASSDLELTLVDEVKKVEVTVHNHLTKGGNQITFEAPETYPIGNEWLNSLLSVAFLSAKNFTSLSGKEQALLLGIDCKKFDARIESLRSDYTVANKELKAIGEVHPVEKAVPVSVTDLVKAKDAIEQFNWEQLDRETKINSEKGVLSGIKSQAKGLEEQIAKLQKQLGDAQAKEQATEMVIAHLPKPQARKSTEALTNQIESAEETNRKAALYEEFLKNSKAKEEKTAALAKVKAEAEKVKRERTEFIQSFRFGFKSMEVDEEGSLLLDGRPVKEPYFSRSELEIIVARIYASLKPELKVRFIDDFECLDEANQEKLLKELVKSGFQVITAEVGKASKGENTVLLRECAIVSEYTEQEKLL